ncbi:DNA helicase [Tanacetum coccineum]|uniref:ATP-dependent DNA helicase n=1 Tax=Tanacetum coccineum TaxID=301880 RepID=A0ABQ5I3P7_9ASTR
MYAMTSFGAKIDESINAGRGEAPRFLQLYIYDTNNEVENRMRHFDGIHNSDLDPQMVKGLIHFLDTYNELGKKNYNACLLQISAPFSLAAVRFDFQVWQTISTIRRWLYDAISQGEHDGYEVGGRVILPMSFTGGPRFSDGCVPGIFEQKIQSCRLLLQGRMLYTVEFQKQGLPHCHTLLWVDSESKIKSAEDVDQYISAELPDPRVDPDGSNRDEAAPSRAMVEKFRRYVEGHFICAHEAYWRIFKAACEALGLLGDDREWETTLEEACVSSTSEQLICVFSHILLHCDVADPSKVWTKYLEQMSQDIPKKVSEKVKHSSGKPSLAVFVRKERLYWQLHLQSTQLGKLLADNDLIICDEAPMNDRHCFEALDRSLRDIVNSSSSLFRGKSVLLGGDFRQTLPG